MSKNDDLNDINSLDAAFEAFMNWSDGGEEVGKDAVTEPPKAKKSASSTATRTKPASKSRSSLSDKERTELLLKLSKDIAKGQKLSDLLLAILDDIIAFCAADRGVLFLFENFEELLSGERHTYSFQDLKPHLGRKREGKPLDEKGLRVSESILQNTLERKEAIFVMDAPGGGTKTDSMVSLSLTSVMAAPIRAQQVGSIDVVQAGNTPRPRNHPGDGVVIGVLYVDSTNVADFLSPEDLSLFEALVSYAGMALENKWTQDKMKSLLQESRMATNRLKTLNKVNKAVSATLVLDELLVTIVDSCIELCGAERGCLIQRSDGRRGDIRMARSSEGRDLQPESLRISRSIADRALLHGTPTIIDDMEAERILAAAGGSIADLQLKAVMCVPLFRPSLQKQKVGDLTDTPVPANIQPEQDILGCIYVDSRIYRRTFTKADLHVLESFATQAAISFENARLFEETEEQLYETVAALAATIDAKDQYTHGHSYRVAQYSICIAEELGYSKGELRRLELGGLLHDIGKVGVPDAVLSKPARLTDEEFELMKQHPVYGYNIVSKVKKMQDLLGCMEHHERMDGRGYPWGLKGDEISIEGRIVCVGDAFDAMTSDRTYRKGLDVQIALDELQSKAGTQFDQDCVDAFMRAYRKGAITKILEHGKSPD